MATITPSFSTLQNDGSVVVVTWAALTTTNSDGAPLDWTQWADRCISFTGTFGAGGTVVLQGSNDGTNYFTLNNAQGTALSFTAAGLKQAVELPLWVRPFVSAGDGTTSITAILVARRQQPLRV